VGARLRIAIEDLYEMVKLMLGELDRYWQPVDEARLP
jgi:hypothetical protein